MTAALRAGYAWSVRHEQIGAWREVARMTGVIMRSFPPGHGPATPAELIPLLRQPLGSWLPETKADPALACLTILDDDDELTEDTFEIGCDYTVELLDGKLDPSVRWLPSWRIHRAEQVENATFHALINGSETDYAKGRRFLVDHPAGTRDELLQRQTELALPPLAEFVDIPQERQWRGWWWPCPHCRWPMRVRAGHVSCSFPHHDATYTLLDSGQSAPRLQPAGGARRARAARPVQDAVCVNESVWRYVVVPGVVEVRLHDRIAALDGVASQLYPGKDMFDILVRPADCPPDQSLAWEVSLDVKDHRSARALAEKLTASPVPAQYVVLPRYRKYQLRELIRLLPSVQFVAEDRVVARIKQIVGRHGGAR